LIFSIHDSAKARKPYYEYIDKIVLKSNFQVIYSCFTGDNILWRRLSLEESDPDKLIASLIKHTKEEMALIDFIRWIIPFEFLVQDVSPPMFAWAIKKFFKKKKIKSFDELKELYNKEFKWFFEYLPEN